MHVFTYGTLMFPEVWQSVVGRSFVTVSGEAPGFRIFRVSDAVFPGISEASQADSVPGVVYLDVDPESTARLDRFEDNFYERRAIAVDCNDGRRRMAEAYVVPEANRGVLTCEPWTRESFLVSGGLEQFITRFAGFGRVAGD
jgi:gamma-glutamylcyclotransferase (GGCT)/AIG2-like uncharacterized protein YtfP